MSSEIEPAPPVTIRDATPADAEALTRLATDSFVETFGHLYAPADLQAFLAVHTPDNWRARLADPARAIRVAVSGDILVGYAEVGPPKLPVDTGPHALELSRFYVLQPWHGTGVAPVLMDWVLATARARGATELYLSVFEDNARARRFYDRYGFRFVAPYAFMVGNHADTDHILRLDL